MKASKMKSKFIIIILLFIAFSNGYAQTKAFEGQTDNYLEQERPSASYAQSEAIFSEAQSYKSRLLGWLPDPEKDYSTEGEIPVGNGLGILLILSVGYNLYQRGKLRSKEAIKQ